MTDWVVVVALAVTALAVWRWAHSNIPDPRPHGRHEARPRLRVADIQARIRPVSERRAPSPPGSEHRRDPR